VIEEDRQRHPLALLLIDGRWRAMSSMEPSRGTTPDAVIFLCRVDSEEREAFRLALMNSLEPKNWPHRWFDFSDTRHLPNDAKCS
jgi:hypothetical protein